MYATLTSAVIALSLLSGLHVPESKTPDANQCVIEHSRGSMMGESTTLLYKRIQDVPRRVLEITCTRRPGGQADVVVRLPLAEGEMMPAIGEYVIRGGGLNEAEVVMHGAPLQEGRVSVRSHGMSGVAVLLNVEIPSEGAKYRIKIPL